MVTAIRLNMNNANMLRQPPVYDFKSHIHTNIALYIIDANSLNTVKPYSEHNKNIEELH